MRVLAVDIGTVRLGFAVSDPLKLTAQPLPTMEGGGVKRICKTVMELVREYESAEQEQTRVETVVIGHPVHLDGKESEMSLLAEECVRRLKEYFRQNFTREIGVVLKDERLSSVEAERIMIEGGARRAERRLKKDQIAAQLILQRYLDAQQT